MIEGPDARLARLILALGAQGVTDPQVLSAIERTPRDIFTQEIFKDRSWETRPCPSNAARLSASPTSSA